MKKVLLIIGIIAIIIILTALIKLFLIGRVMYTSSSFSEEQTVESQSVSLKYGTTNSMYAFRGYSYRTENNCLYIKIYGVFPSFIFKDGNGTIKINGDFSKLEKIYFEDSNEKKLVWSAKNT